MPRRSRKTKPREIDPQEAWERVDFDYRAHIFGGWQRELESGLEDGDAVDSYIWRTFAWHVMEAQDILEELAEEQKAATSRHTIDDVVIELDRAMYPVRELQRRIDELTSAHAAEINAEMRRLSVAG